MILGNLEIRDGAVHTARDSYMIKTVTVVSCRRVFFVPSAMLGAGMTGYAGAFSDLLYSGEIIGLLGMVGAIVTAGSQLGQLKLLSRDLQSSELSAVIWGHYRTLNAKRLEIAAHLNTGPSGGGS